MRFLKAGEERYRAIVEPPFRKLAAEFANLHLRNQIPSRSDLRALLTPDYPFGCKRVLLSDDFFPAMSQPHVELETRRIEKLGQQSVITAEGVEHVVDIILFATGFRSQNFTFGVDIVGLEGRSLQGIWRDHPRAYHGVVVEALPNFGMLYGPNTNLNHASVLLMIEAQARHLSAMIQAVHKARMVGIQLAIRPQPQKVEEYNRGLQDRLHKTVFVDPRCPSWYKAQDGRVVNNWPGTAIEYQRLLSTIDWDHFDTASSQKASITIRKKDKQPLQSVVEETSLFALTTNLKYFILSLFYGVVLAIHILQKKI